MPESRKRKRVIVIGLDGGTFTVLKPWMEEGMLPNLDSISKNGVTGELLSTIPPVTGPAWASFMTGKSPGKHGIYDFVRPSADGTGMDIVSYDSISSETVFSILSRHGKMVGAVNLPLTYPLPEVNGFAISGMLTPKSAVRWMYPEGLEKRLKERGIRYVQDVWWQRYDEWEVKGFLTNLLRCTEERINTVRYLMTDHDWDLFITVFIGTDRIQHCLWDLIFPSPGTKDPEKGKALDLVKKYYRAVDTFIGEARARMDEDTTLLIVSDHGFGPLKGKVFINKVLSDWGYLRFDAEKLSALRRRITKTSGLKRVVKRMDVLGLRGIVGPFLMKKAKRMSAYDFLECIDWSKTVAFAASNTEQGIYINLKGRGPQGVVEREKYEGQRDEIMGVLKGLTHPETGEKMVSHVFRREEVYKGPFVEKAPDIVFFLRSGEYLADVQPSDRTFEEKTWRSGSGTHRAEGIFMACGKDIKNGEALKGARIVDVLPTLLFTLGLPIPDDLDGVILRDIFKEEAVEEKEPLYARAVAGKRGKALSYTEDEASEIEERLKGLGYL